MTARRLLSSPLLSLALVVVCAATALAVRGGLTPRAERPAHARAAAASGALKQTNSRDGAAILGAPRMRPGDSVTGEVTIANSGDLTGAFQLDRTAIADQTGPGGGRLSDLLSLQVLDVTDAAAPVAVFSGSLGALGARGLGSFAPGQARTYRFTATLPDSGTGADNAFAGSSTAVGFVWTASAPEPPVTGSGTTPPPTGGGSAVPRVTTVSANGALIDLTLPGACVQRGGTFRAKLGWRRMKRKGNVFVKVRRTDFYVGSKRVKIDKRAPFVAKLKVPLTATAGGTLTVRARAFIKVRKGRSPKKSIRARVRVCG